MTNPRRLPEQAKRDGIERLAVDAVVHDGDHRRSSPSSTPPEGSSSMPSHPDPAFVASFDDVCIRTVREWADVTGRR